MKPANTDIRHKRAIFFIVPLVVFSGALCALLVSCSNTKPEVQPGSETIPAATTPMKTETFIPGETPTKTPFHTPLGTRTPVPASSATEIAYPAEIIDSQGIEMALVPAGEFMMGDDSGQDYERPAHIVYLDAFYMDTYEVTNKLYRDCVNAGVCRPPEYTGSETRSSYFENPEYDDYPVIYVSWEMASNYCKWRDAELPTEAQWEKAARGTDGRRYPWGEGIDCSKANYLDLRTGSCVGDTTAVGSYESGKSPYGLYDMAGNVWEWVADWYSESYYRESPPANPLGPDSGQHRMLRGGGWPGQIYHLYTFGRHVSLDEYPRGYNDAGFRCAISLR